jgi:hypothetical protein
VRGRAERLHRETEIHPIVGLAAEETLGDTKFVQVFAFADDSGNSPATVPHSGVNRIAHLRVPFAPHPALPFHKVVPKFRIKNEWRHVKARHFTVDESVSPPELDVFIETGVADDDQGFYFGSLVLDYDDTRMIIPYDVIPGSPRLRITHIETRNYRSTRGPTHQHYTSAIGGTDNGTFWKLRKDVAIHLIETNAKTFFTADAEGHESDVLVVQPHRDPHDEFFYPYLQTASDAFPGNNLSKLPKCPMYLDEVNP